ncbi:class I SAM-dependent methyltransferase [Methylomonas sp. MED-D]|uniref:class I SAM-dependent methyltransferase n=1 Tax=unclassified Methylomonas TaxID=2608980 RepID=UPI0028A5136D|nr:class I SAM-dependent methyltransferase [Methylomonas sp. MV1]MDT4328977.1 class I SAM-dependent methyltransferase [Methylomonas sp. MV1]
MLFDESYYIEINEARWSAADQIISNLPSIYSCIDMGCGPGWFANKLVQKGLLVRGIDGREELVNEARQRVPEAKFHIGDVTSNSLFESLPSADLVFCFGLLYHLENPFAAIRSISKVASRFLLIETQISPGDAAEFKLVSEGRNETQGLTYHALIPSRAALIKMLFVSGFNQVLRYTGSVDHLDFIDSPTRIHRREIFLAARDFGEFRDFVTEVEPVTPKIDYTVNGDG